MCSHFSEITISKTLIKELYLLMGELRYVSVWVTGGLHMAGRLQTDSVYCPEPEMERPMPLLSLKQGRKWIFGTQSYIP